METYYEFIRKGDKNSVDGWLGQLDEAYHSGSAALSDENYDNLIKVYESRFGKRQVVGSKPTHSPVQLPIAMMSLDKIMSEKELESFMNKNPGPYIVMSKINGNASLYRNGMLYNRGDGTEGTDLSHMLEHLNLPPSSKYVKGELVINKDDYLPFREDYKTNLSMINGLLNSHSADPERLKLFKFIAYDIAGDGKMSDTLQELEKTGFIIPWYQKFDTLTIELLSSLYNNLREEASYEVDGLVICADREVKYEERLVRENPDYMIAFKEYGETKVGIVTEVVWEDSKRMKIKPTIKIEPVVMSDNYKLESFGGFNAAWVRDNNVGKGTQLIVTRNTTPQILSVLEGTVAELPPNPETWKWNETGVDILLLDENDNVRIKKLYEFFLQIDAKYVGETTIRKMYNAGYNTVKKILDMKKDDFMERKIEGLGEGIYDRMSASIEEAMSRATLAQILSASCAFGNGFGVKKISAILQVFPNLLEMSEITLEDITSIKGFAEKTAQKFIDNLPKAKTFLKEIEWDMRNKEKKNRTPQNKSLEKKVLKLSVKKSIPTKKKEEIQESDVSFTSFEQREVNDASRVLRGKSVVFTGFRDNDLESRIGEVGGKVTTSVSKSTGYVVVGGVKGENSSKEKKAVEYNIPILTLKEFRTKFGF